MRMGSGVAPTSPVGGDVWYDGTNVVARTGSVSGTFGTSLLTGAPSGGTAGVWKLGILVTTASVFDTTRYIQLDVGGTLYKLAVCQ